MFTSSEKLRSFARDAWQVALYLALATLLQMLARSFRLDPSSGVWYWVPALTVAFAMSAPPRLLWATFLAPMPHKLLLGFWGPAYGTVLTICLAHGCAYGLGGWLLRRMGVEPSLRRARDLTIFLIFAVVAPIFFAIPTSWVLTTRFNHAYLQLAPRILSLWGEDSVGLLGLTPPLLLLHGIHASMRKPLESLSLMHPVRIAEVLVQGMTLAAVPLIILLNPQGANFPWAYTGFLPLLWVALRWGFRGAALGVLLFTGAMGGQYVALGLPFRSLSELQILLLVMGATSLVVGHLVDVRSDHRRTMQHQGVQLSTLLRGTGAAPFEMDARTGQCTMIGKSVLIASGHSMEEWQREPYWSCVIDPVFVPRLQTYLRDLIDETGSSTVELALQSAGHPRWIEVSGTALGRGALVGGFLHDITERKVLERKLETSEAYYRQLVDQSLIPTAVYQDGRFVYVNAAALTLLGYRREEFLGKPINILIHPEEMDDSVERRARVIQGEAVDPVERRLLRSDGSVVMVDLLSIPCQHEGRLAVQVLAVDLTARKAAEAHLKVRIKEKELVIREIHHRVKNNLQVVSSLLRLQGSMHPDPLVKQALDQAQGRIQAIAAVHQRLHQAPSLAPEDLQEYVMRLVEQLVQTFSPTPGLITTEVAVEPLALGADQLVPLGLIIHELVLNAIRHAFPLMKGGRIALSLHAEGRDIALQVSDNGKGLQVSPLAKGTGLGFQLVRALTDQLKGQLTHVPSEGTTLRIRFPAPPSPSA
jgi:PAS domain S-box-containing protein